jgi:hypothetical protein
MPTAGGGQASPSSCSADCSAPVTQNAKQQASASGSTEPAHGYVRFTEDLDLGVNTDLGTLRQAADALRTAGFKVELREPDGQDPLGACQNWRLSGLDPLIEEATGGS